MRWDLFYSENALSKNGCAALKRASEDWEWAGGSGGLLAQGD